MAGSFEKQRVLSPSEYRVFAIIEAEITAQGGGYRVFAQTSLGEILRSKNEDAFRSINSKRVDILVIDRSGWPYLAVEYQGDGHYQDTAAARDAVKKEALRKAGVRYMEFCPTDSDDKIRSHLARTPCQQGQCYVALIAVRALQLPPGLPPGGFVYLPTFAGSAVQPSHRIF